MLKAARHLPAIQTGTFNPGCKPGGCHVCSPTLHNQRSHQGLSQKTQIFLHARHVTLETFLARTVNSVFVNTPGGKAGKPVTL